MSHLGPANRDNSIIGQIASYWYNILGKQCWWSDGQTGYYFTNLRNDYMSQTHVHVYSITHARGNTYNVHMALKQNDIQIGTVVVSSNFHNITNVITYYSNYVVRYPRV